MYTLFITRGYPTDKYKTNGIFEFDQAKALAKKGCKVVYLAIDLRSIRRWRKWGIERQNIEGVDIYAINIPLGRIPKNILRKFSFWGLKTLYKKIIKEQGKPDILHAHFTSSAYSASKLKDITGIPLITTEHSSQINKENIDENLYNIAKIAYSKSDSIIAVSPSLVKVIKNKFNEDSIYIPNLVDLNIFQYETKKYDENFNFVSTGNLINTKRMDLTIEALYKAFRGNPKIKLTIFGQGPKHKMLQELIDKYNLNSQVKLRGLCSREKIAEKLKVTDCFVLASQSETFGVAYIEALAMGVPVIATKCGGPEAFVNDENGLLVNVDNLNELSEAMKYMYDNIDKYDGESIARKIVEEFSPDAVADRIMEVYTNALHN